MMARSIGLALTMAALVACAAITTVHHKRVAAEPACSWTEPRHLTVGANGLVHVETPQIVRTRGGLTFFGDNALILASHDTGFERLGGWPRGPGMLAGVIRRPNGRLESVALPHYLRSFIAVRAVGDDSGNAHVFWGESADTTVDQHLHVRSIWYARFDGDQWSEPEQVFSDKSIPWLVVATALVGRGRDVHFVLPLGFTGGNMVHARRLKGHWIVKRLPFTGMYAGLAALPDGSLVLAYIEGTDHDRAVVFVTRSSDEGATWSPPATLYRSGRGAAFAPRLVQGPDALFAIWQSAPPLPAGTPGEVVATMDKPDSLQAATSADGGASWRRLGGLLVPGGVNGLEAGLGPDGLPHAAFTINEGDAASTGSVALGPDGWSRVATLGTGPFWVSLGSPPHDSLYLAWDVWQSAGPYRVPLTVYSSYGCAGSQKRR